MARSAGTPSDSWKGCCSCWWLTQFKMRTARRVYGLFRREKQRRARGDDMKTVKVEKARIEKPRMVTYRREPGSPLTAKQKANLAELAKRPEHEIDTSDIPE